MAGEVKPEVYRSPAQASFREKLGPGGLASLLLAFATNLLGLGLPVAWRLRHVLRQAARDDRGPADAILVLGRQLDGDEPSPVFRARLAHAAELWRAGLAPRVVVAGGITGASSRSEAAVGRDLLAALGVPRDCVWLEEHSQHTLENLWYVRQTLRREGLSRLLLVSDPLHLARALAMARGLALDVVASPAKAAPPRPGTTAWWWRAVRESFFLHWYRTGIVYSRLIRSERQLVRVT